MPDPHEGGDRVDGEREVDDRVEGEVVRRGGAGEEGELWADDGGRRRAEDVEDAGEVLSIC